MNIPRLTPPAAPWTAEGWCLYEDDRWTGPVPHEWDDDGWWVYPDKASAFAGLAREMRQRCEEFAQGLLGGESLACSWYPVPVTYLANGRVRDESGEHLSPGNAAGEADDHANE